MSSQSSRRNRLSIGKSLTSMVRNMNAFSFNPYVRVTLNSTRQSVATKPVPGGGSNPVFTKDHCNSLRLELAGYRTSNVQPGANGNRVRSNSLSSASQKELKTMFKENNGEPILQLSVYDSDAGADDLVGSSFTALSTLSCIRAAKEHAVDGVSCLMEHKLTGMDSTFAGVIKVRYTFEPGRTLTDSELFGTTSISKGKTLWRKVSVAVGMSAMAKGKKTKPASVYSVQQDSSDILSKNISNGPVEEHDPLSEKTRSARDDGDGDGSRKEIDHDNVLQSNDGEASDEDQILIVPHGVLTVEILRCIELSDPNEQRPGDARLSASSCACATLLVIMYFLIGIFVFQSLESREALNVYQLANGIGVNATLNAITEPLDLKFKTAVDVIYFSVQTFTTVGYGDVVPQTDGGKLFAAFFALWGVAMIAVCINTILTFLQASCKEQIFYPIRAGFRKCSGKSLDLDDFDSDDDEVHEMDLSKGQIVKRILTMLLLVVSMILFGAFIYGQDNMISDGEPGLQFTDGVYLCTMTLATIGYGDISPQNQQGRIFSIIYTIFGYVVLSRCFKALAEMYFQYRTRQLEKKILSKDMGMNVLHIDSDGDGEVNKFEFLSHMLVSMGKVRRDDINEICRRFDEMDTSGDGLLTAEDFAAAMATYKK